METTTGTCQKPKMTFPRTVTKLTVWGDITDMDKELGRSKRIRVCKMKKVVHNQQELDELKSEWINCIIYQDRDNRIEFEFEKENKTEPTLF